MAMIIDKMPGRDPEAFALQACIMEAGDGDYLEIGVMVGESLCFAGLVKRMLGHTGRLYGIDKNSVLKAEVDKNLDKHALRATVFYKPSHPWPAGDIFPTVAYIDGGHEFEFCSEDWRNLSPRTKRFIVCHDYPSIDGVAKMVDEIAMRDHAWRRVIHIRRTVVFERCASS